VPAAILTLVSTEAAEWVPDIAGLQDISHSALASFIEGTTLVRALEKSGPIWKPSPSTGCNY
jgi:hypothetical protein